MSSNKEYKVIDRKNPGGDGTHKARVLMNADADEQSGAREDTANDAAEICGMESMASVLTPDRVPSPAEIAISEKYDVIAGPALAAAQKKRPAENSASRPCINCGLRVRAGEGRYGRPTETKSGEKNYPVKHLGDCPSSQPKHPDDDPTDESLMKGVRRLTPADGGPRTYAIDGHGEYPSVTTVLSGGGTPYLLANWQKREAVHAGRAMHQLSNKDVKDWERRSMNAPSLITAEAAAFGTASHGVCEDIIIDRLGGVTPDVESHIQRHVRDDESMREQYVDRVARRVDAFLQWEQEWVDEWVGAEIVCWSDSERYAGSADAMAMVYPAKFGPILDSNGEQKVKWDEPVTGWMPDRDADPVMTVVDWKTSKSWQDRDKPEIVSSTKNIMQGAAYSTAEFFLAGDGSDGPTPMPEEGQSMVVHLGVNESVTQGVPPEDVRKWKEAFAVCREVVEAQRKLEAVIDGI